MQIEPLQDRLVLEPIEEDTITSSGIYIPDTNAKERPFMYKVVAIGPGKKDIDMTTVSVGDTVLCGQYSGDEVKLDGKDYKVVGIDYILGKITS